MTLELTVKTEDAGTRLDAFIAAHAPELTRSQAARLIEEGAVTVGSARPAKSARVAPGETVAAVVTEAGIALNPKHKNYAELKEDLEKTSLKLVTIEELQQLAESLTGVPKPIETSDRVACIVEYRDGTVIDVIREVKH